MQLDSSVTQGILLRTEQFVLRIDSPSNRSNRLRYRGWAAFKINAIQDTPFLSNPSHKPSTDSY